MQSEPRKPQPARATLFGPRFMDLYFMQSAKGNVALVTEKLPTLDFKYVPHLSLAIDPSGEVVMVNDCVFTTSVTL